MYDFWAIILTGMEDFSSVGKYFPSEILIFRRRTFGSSAPKEALSKTRWFDFQMKAYPKADVTYRFTELNSHATHGVTPRNMEIGQIKE